MKKTTRRKRYSGWKFTVPCPVTGKPGYGSRNEARRAASELKFRTGGVVLEVYRCPDCRKWHMTKQAWS